MIVKGKIRKHQREERELRKDEGKLERGHYCDSGQKTKQKKKESTISFEFIKIKMSTDIYISQNFQ